MSRVKISDQRLPLLVRFVTVFFSPSRQIVEHYLKMLPHPFQLMMEIYTVKKILFKLKSEKVIYPPLCKP